MNRVTIGFKKFHLGFFLRNDMSDEQATRLKRAVYFTELIGGIQSLLQKVHVSKKCMFQFTIV